MKSEYTKGEWGIYGIGQKDCRPLYEIIALKNGKFHKAICDVWAGISNDEGYANARLIAQAPKLVEACLDALAWLRNDTNLATMENELSLISPMHKLQQAIASVEGK